jgi:hypothetical protein
MSKFTGRWLRRLVAVFAVAATVMVAGAGAASAVVPAENTYVYGWGDWTWNANGQDLNNVSLYVEDRECNGVGVYIRMRVWYVGSSTPTSGTGVAWSGTAAA